jgi:hypothetical protein
MDESVNKISSLMIWSLVNTYLTWSQKLNNWPPQQGRNDLIIKYLSRFLPQKNKLLTLGN